MPTADSTMPFGPVIRRGQRSACPARSCGRPCRACHGTCAPRRGRIALASSPCGPAGNATRNVTTMSVSRLPSASLISSASTATSNASGSARREVRMSMSIAVQPPTAASSSVGVNSVPPPVPNVISCHGHWRQRIVRWRPRTVRCVLAIAQCCHRTRSASAAGAWAVPPRSPSTSAAAASAK